MYIIKRKIIRGNYMYLLFAEYQGYVRPLLAYDDKDVVMNKCISVSAICDMCKLLAQNIEKVTKYYVSGYHFKDVDNGEFYALVKLIDNKVDEVLRLSKSKYAIDDYCDLVTKENKDENRVYTVFKFRGTLDE